MTKTLRKEKKDIIRLLRGIYLLRADGLHGKKLDDALAYNAQFEYVIMGYAYNAVSGKMKSIEWFEKELEKIVEKDEDFHFWTDRLHEKKESAEWLEKEIEKIIKSKYEEGHFDENTTKNNFISGIGRAAILLL